ncbi:MAG: patatin-like phospholipase family protein [Longimicrobiales bacterium]
MVTRTRRGGSGVPGALALVVALCASAGPVEGRQTTPVPRTVGLALSGGSAKGIAHVGVLRALERLGVRVDVVAGTSMGGVVGAMYALGLSVDSIESVMRSADWPSLMTDATPRGRRSLDQRRFDDRAILAVPLEGPRVALPAGAILGSNAMRLLEHVMWRAGTVRRFEDLPRPFGAVATDLETGEPIPLRTGVLAQSLRASAGLPGALEPITLDGRLLVDGALSRNLPAVDARELGADFVVCSDVSAPIDSAEELQSFVDVLSQLASLSMLEATLAQRALCDVLILPDVDELSSFDFDQVDEWVTRGERATLEHETALSSLALARPPRERFGAAPTLLGDSVMIASVAIEGVTDVGMIDLVRRELELETGDFVGRDQMASRLADLESSGFFGLVRYRLDEQADGAALTVHVQERPRDRLGVGLRYDDERRAALLFTATLHNLLLRGSVTRLDLRVGEEMRIGASLRRRRGLTGRLGVGAAVHWSQAPLVLPAAQGGPTDVDLWSGSLSLGLVAARSAYLGVEGVLEHAEDARGQASARTAAAAIVLDHETLDRIDFPRGGLDVTGRAEWGISDVGAGGEYMTTTLDARAFLPLGSRITADLGVFAGYTQGGDLPAHERLFLGGAYRSAVFTSTHPTFQGLHGQEQMGNAVQVARVGLRLEPTTDWFLRAGVDVGASRDEWRLPLARPMTGWALSGGFRSRIGPVVGEVSKVWGGRHDPRVSVSVGRSF